MGIDNMRISSSEIQKSESNLESKEKKEGYKKTTITLYGEGGGNQSMSVDEEFLQNEVGWYLLCKKAVDELNQKYGFDIDKAEAKWDRNDSPSTQEAMYFFDKDGQTIYGVYPRSIVEYLDAKESVVPILVKKGGAESMDWEELTPSWRIIHSNDTPDEKPAHQTNADLDLEYNK